MKFTIDKKSLIKHINIAQKAISSKSTMQILEGIVFDVRDGYLTLISTDLELSVETRVKCDVIEEGSVVINSSIIGNIIRKLPDDIISFTVKDDNINIKCQKSVFNIMGQDASNYPSLPEVENQNTISLNNEELKQAIKETEFSASTEDTRLALTGLLLEKTPESINLVGLDGYRLAVKKIPYSNTEVEEVIVPRRAMLELSKIVEDGMTSIKTVKGHIVFENEETKLFSRLIDKKYIAYKEIISSDYRTKLQVNKDDFLAALERASLLAKEEKANLVVLTIEDNMIRIQSNTEIGNVDEKISSRQEGEDLQIAFNARYLIEGVKAQSEEELVLYFNESLNPMQMHPAKDEDSYIYLALPVRVGR